MFPSAPSRGRWRGRESKGTGLRCVLRGTTVMYVCWRGGGGSISSLSFLSTVSIQPHHLYLHPTHSSSGTLAVISPSSQDLSLPAFCVTFFVLWALWFIDRQEAVCTCNCMVTVKTEERGINHMFHCCHKNIDEFFSSSDHFLCSEWQPTVMRPLW